MGTAVRLEFDWEEAPGVQDKVLAETWARLSLKIGDLCLSEAIDLRSNSRRTGIYGSLFPLAEWIVEQWWHLLHEPPPCSPVPGGRAAPNFLRSWFQRHNLLAARDGGALPDLTIIRDGDDIAIQWEADPVSETLSRVRFVGQGTFRVQAKEFENAVRDFVNAIIARLQERIPGNEDLERLLEGWNAVRSSNADERKLCESLAVMGVDPYDPDEATDVLVDAVEHSIRNLPDKIRADLLEGSDSESFMTNLKWVEKERSGLGGEVGRAGFPTIDLVAAPSAHQTGYLTAHRVRSELLGLTSDSPIQDLATVFEKHLGWAQGCSKMASGTTCLDGMVGLDAAASAPILVVADTRNPCNERFRLARAAFFPVTKMLGGNARLLTNSATPQQRAARAFAAELLAPAEALKRRVSGRINTQEAEQLAEEFSVSSQVISHQVQNHGLGYVEP